MAKQVIVTQFDTGILIKALYEENKTPMDLTGCTTEIQIVDPNDQKLDLYFGIPIDLTNGIVGFLIDSTMTQESGLYKTYWQVINEFSEVTAQNEFYYYVKEKFGGVE